MARGCQATLSAAKKATLVESEHPLSDPLHVGSTGKPKDLHTSRAIWWALMLSTKYVFDVRDDDVYWCTADVGVITGHSYLVYGPLSNGATR